MKPTNFLAFKYLFSKTRFNIVSIISLFSIIVLSVSYFSFTVILSVLSGLENYSLQFSKSFDPEIKVSQKNNQLIILDNSDLDFLLKHKNYENWLEKKKISKLDFCVNFIKRLKYLDIVTFGINDNTELQQIIQCMKSKKKITYRKFSIYNNKIIDPRYWN